MKPIASGELVDIADPAATCNVPLSTLYGLLERIEDRHGSDSGDQVFPWYYEAFDHDTGQSPTSTDCRPPMAMLKSLQRIEAELARMKSRLPSEWTFVVPQADGSQKRLLELNAYYKGKAVRLFGDDDGCWAVETDTPLGFPPHHELKGKKDVTVRLEPDGAEISVVIDEWSYATHYRDILQRLKQVCIVALNHDASVLTSTA